MSSIINWLIPKNSSKEDSPQKDPSLQDNKMDTEEEEDLPKATKIQHPCKIFEDGYDYQQYSFSPLLLFTTEAYFDKGYSNYNSVEEFFRDQIDIDMLTNVLYDRKNLKYHELLNQIVTNKMLIVCCIDAHFTALQVLNSSSLLYYDPMNSQLQFISGQDSVNKFIIYHIMKCKYGDQEHVSENRDFYTGSESDSIKKYIYQVWKNLADVTVDRLGVKQTSIKLPLNEYYFINNKQNNSLMSTQLTSCTCYFQTYLFALLMRVCKPTIVGSKLELKNKEKLKKVSIIVCKFLNQFYFDENVMRPYSNNNIIIDFQRFQGAAYYTITQNYLRQNNIDIQYQNQINHLKTLYEKKLVLQLFNSFKIEDKMSSQINTQQLQLVNDTQDANWKLCQFNYYKYRPANMTFGFNTNIMRKIESFNQFNSLRKNFMLSVYPEVKNILNKIKNSSSTKYKDYYFLPQFEIGQQELIDLHQYCYELDIFSITKKSTENALMVQNCVKEFNLELIDFFNFSTQQQNNYEKMMSKDKFLQKKDYYSFYLNYFMSLIFFKEYCSLGFNEFNPKEKEINALTQSVFYSVELMRRQMFRNEFEFERECINQMAKSTLSKYIKIVDTNQDLSQSYQIIIKIGFGITYSKYNNLTHFINVIDNYWNNPDINYIHVFGKDIRILIGFLSQKIAFSKEHDFYHYGHVESNNGRYSSQGTIDLLFADESNQACPVISETKYCGENYVIISDKVYEFNYVKQILQKVFSNKEKKLKSDDVILNLNLLNLMLDFGLYDEYNHLLNLDFMDKKHLLDKRQLQVKISNMISEMDKENKESIHRPQIEELLYEAANKFIVNHNFNINSQQFKLINTMNGNKVYHPYVVLIKIYMSLCNINKSVELDYYKIKCDNEYKIIIPQNYSKTTSDYLDQITSQYSFYEQDKFICYDNLKIFDLSQQQPTIHLYKIRLISQKKVESMYRYIEISNTFTNNNTDEEDQLIFFISGSIVTLQNQTIQNNKQSKSKAIQIPIEDELLITINKNKIQYNTMYFNEAMSFIPCFKYLDNDDCVILTSQNMYYHVDTAGQFNDNYYGMKHELIELIKVEMIFVDLNEQYQFKEYQMSKILQEFKTVIYHPHYLMQIKSVSQMISILDFTIKIRNISFFILILMFLERSVINLTYVTKENRIQKITGPWLEALRYIYQKSDNKDYDKILSKQFFQIDDYKDKPLTEFIDIVCENFTKYQKYIDGVAQIIPTQKQKKFIEHIITGEHSFYFSEVGSGKTKVIMPILCQIFLSNNRETHKYFGKSGQKTCLFIIVPEHLIFDAQQQVFRYCLNLNFKEEYKIFDDVFNFMHPQVQIDEKKKIFVTSFNQFKKALTFDKIHSKIYNNRDQVMLLIDEVDNFLDREKLIFNICSNQNNEFQKQILDWYHDVSRMAYYHTQKNINVQEENSFHSMENSDYWKQLYTKFVQVDEEIKIKSMSINKNFGIFNEYTLRHSKNIAHDIEGYKSLIARPFESVNRAMPGSYYSDVERTIYLTYYILMEDIEKYDQLFQQERKNITYEYYKEHINILDYDELIYGNNKLSKLVHIYPDIKKGLTSYLYKIILKKMEIHDKSRCVNSIDVIFNFDCIGFTGTPFIDNYPTYQYIQKKETGKIPSLIQRDFYVHSNNSHKDEIYKEKFIQFQGENNKISMKFTNSDFIEQTDDENQILKQLFLDQNSDFNTIVDLCGIFKRISIHGVRNVVREIVGMKKFKYIYYINQIDQSDRIFYMENDNDVQYDEEFFQSLTNNYGKNLCEKIFFFIDNSNVIGKDVPFQLIFQNKFKIPLIYKSIIISHDVDDFSKIWQAMGRSRTMNLTKFVIYKSNLQQYNSVSNSKMMDIELQNMQDCVITKHLYIKNCDRKVIGNISSIYQTLISIYNLSQKKMYYDNEIINVFILKMNNSITKILDLHQQKISEPILKQKRVHILENMLSDKFQVSEKFGFIQFNGVNVLVTIIDSIFQKKFEQRIPSNDKFDDIIQFLSGDQLNLNELSYTKQQQKQKNIQHSKNQDSDTMEVFSKDKQMTITVKTDDYYEYCKKDNLQNDIRNSLNYVIFKEICLIKYNENDQIRIFPTIQFLYSLNINPQYIDSSVRKLAERDIDMQTSYKIISKNKNNDFMDTELDLKNASPSEKFFKIKVLCNYIKQNPAFTLLSLGDGIFIIGMKNQFSQYDIENFELHQKVNYISDEGGHVLYQKNDICFEKGPYSLELQIVYNLLTKTELSSNVINAFHSEPEQLKHSVMQYSKKQGEGYLCWRFIMRYLHDKKKNQAIIEEKNNE